LEHLLRNVNKIMEVNVIETELNTLLYLFINISPMENNITISVTVMIHQLKKITYEMKIDNYIIFEY
jgi:hypothetical protein